MAGEDMIKDNGEEVQLETLDGVSADIDDRPAKEKALVRRIDKRMMPLMMLLCKFISCRNLTPLDVFTT
jgi:hypothetical protein